MLSDLVELYLYYCVEDGGDIFTPDKGICRGCALSPLMGAALLYHVDGHFSAVMGIFYARYMDDFVLLTRTRWQLRCRVKQLHEFLT